MPRTLSLEDLCIHQVCLLEQCDFAEALECLARHGVFQTALWRPMLESSGVASARKALVDTGVSPVALCPLVLRDPESPLSPEQQQEDHRRLLDLAAELEVPSVVVITGGLPEGEKDLQAQRVRALEALEALLTEARKLGLRLILEPLHPMVCGLRSVISSLEDANAMLSALEAEDVLGIALDTYALWWDWQLESQIQACGPRIRHLHVSDWLPRTRDLRLDRGMPGDGCIDNRKIRHWLENEGFDGPVEVELFSLWDWWKKPPDLVVETICQRLGVL
jgi:sugar phosphate isomerase/epimerase